MELIPLDRNLAIIVNESLSTIDGLSDAEKDTVHAILGAIENSIKTIGDRSYKLLPRATADAFLRTEDVAELIGSYNTNTKTMITEIDAINAAIEVIQTLATGSVSELKDAIFIAKDSLQTLIAFHKAASDGSNSIAVVSDDLTGSLCGKGKTITAGVGIATDSILTLSDVVTNGMMGNLLEATSSVPIDVDLKSEQISFVDPTDLSNNKQSLVDGDELTLFEVEAYNNPFAGISAIASVSESVLPQRLVSIQKSTKVNGTYEKIDWSAGVAGNTLYCDIVFVVGSGSLSELRISLADKTQQDGSSIPHPIVESVLISQDNTTWTQVSKTQQKVEFLDTSATLVVIVNSPNARYVKIRLTQRITYNTSIIDAAHWFQPADINTEGYWLSDDKSPAYTYGTGDKTDWFSFKWVNNDSSLVRHIFAMPTTRYSIAVKDVFGVVNDYLLNTSSETKDYTFDTAIDRVAISASEVIPSGTSISYEISHDSGKTYTKIFPIERSGSGVGIVAFAQGGNTNPNMKSVTYVSVPVPPKTIRLRITMVTGTRVTPIIRSLNIKPLLVDGT